jgi:acetyl-CoA C-acetyltransferase
VLVVRLFSSLVRAPRPDAQRYGAATLGAIGGLGLAALFEAVR